MDYSGIIKVILINHSDVPFLVNIGDRIAQLVVAKVERATIEETEEVKLTDRDSNGFGTTGVK